jgi:hypothetical protein
MPARTLSTFLALAAALVVARAAAAQVVVLTARGPSSGSFHPGSILPATKVLDLKSGDHLELMDGTGSHVLTGPLVTTAGHVEAGARTKILQDFLTRQQIRPTVAATRGLVLEPIEGPKTAVELWAVDAGDGGVACVPPGVPPTLTRASRDTPAATRVSNLATGESRAVDWPAESLRVEWPSGLPIVDGDRFLISLADSSTSVLRLRTVDLSSGMQGLAAALLVKQCDAQLDRLHAALSRR